MIENPFFKTDIKLEYKDTKLKIKIKINNVSDNFLEVEVIDFNEELSYTINQTIYTIVKKTEIAEIIKEISKSDNIVTNEFNFKDKQQNNLLNNNYLLGFNDTINLCNILYLKDDIYLSKYVKNMDIGIVTLSNSNKNKDIANKIHNYIKNDNIKNNPNTELLDLEQKLDQITQEKNKLENYILSLNSDNLQHKLNYLEEEITKKKKTIKQKEEENKSNEHILNYIIKHKYDNYKIETIALFNKKLIKSNKKVNNKIKTINFFNKKLKLIKSNIKINNIKFRDLQKEINTLEKLKFNNMQSYISERSKKLICDNCNNRKNLLLVQCKHLISKCSNCVNDNYDKYNTCSICNMYNDNILIINL